MDDPLPHNSEDFLASLQEELEHAKHNKPGGQPSDPVRAALIEAEIARVRKALRGGKRETAVARPPLETTAE